MICSFHFRCKKSNFPNNRKLLFLHLPLSYCMHLTLPLLPPPTLPLPPPLLLYLYLARPSRSTITLPISHTRRSQEVANAWIISQCESIRTRCVAESEPGLFHRGRTETLDSNKQLK